MTPTALNWYGLKQFGFDPESLGLTGNMLTDQVAIEALCVRIRHGEHEGGLGAFGHFKNASFGTHGRTECCARHSTTKSLG